MKRIATAAIAAATLIAPMAATSAYADPPRQYRDRQHDGVDGNARQRDRDGRYDRRGRDLRNDGIDGNAQRAERWERSRHNGYWANGRFNYGPPPASVFGYRDYRPGYQAWRRGDRLPAYYRSNYREYDWRRGHMRAPPRGYHYVRDDRGEILLVGIATGVILSIIASQ